MVVPKEGALVVVAPNPAGLFPNRVWKENNSTLETWHADTTGILSVFGCRQGSRTKAKHSRAPPAHPPRSGGLPKSPKSSLRAKLKRDFSNLSDPVIFAPPEPKITKYQNPRLVLVHHNLQLVFPTQALRTSVSPVAFITPHITC